MRYNHEKSKEKNCSICNKTLANNQSLKIHLALAHLSPSKQIKKFCCELCKKAFRTSPELRFHVKQVHDQIRDFSCEHCEKQFFTKQALTIHNSAIHERLEEYGCTLCDKRFNTKTALGHHLKTHGKSYKPRKKIVKAPQIFKCERCSKQFKYSSHLKRHVNSEYAHRKFFNQPE